MKYSLSFLNRVLAMCVLVAACLCFLMPKATYAQELQECGTVLPEGLTPQSLAPYGEPGALLDFLPTAVRHITVVVHVVRYNDGSGGISQNDITTAKQQLNAAYQSSMITFIGDSIDYINNSTYANLNLDGNYQQLFQINRVAGALNVYFVPNITDNQNRIYNGVAEGIPGRACAVRNAVATNATTLPHEVGHDFYLIHTHETALGVERINRTDLPGCPANCSTAGDLLCDTPADPNLLNRTGANCQYVPGSPAPTDPCGNSNYAPDMRNYMSYAAQCRNSFTEGQIGRMHYALTTLISDLIQVSVAVSNKVNGSPHSGSTLTINGQVITSPGNIPLLDGSNYPGKTNHERLAGDNKHKDWNDIAAEYTLSQDFTVNRTTELGRRRDANFYGLTPVAVTTQLIETGTSGGNIQFRDPWYLADASGSQPNQFFTYSAPFSPTGAYNQSTGGVFLDQQIISGRPYYSVGAPSVNTIDGIESYFVNWQGNASEVQYRTADKDTTAVVFKTSNATAVARYKGHLISSSAQVTAFNTQRKVVRDRYGAYHMVYESGNQIWYTQSVDEGATG